MKSLTLRITTGLIAGATLVAAAAPAEARWRGRDRGDRTALAVGAGLVGLGVGAAIASSGRDRWDRWDRGYRGGWDRRGGWGWRGRYDPRFAGPGWGGPGWGYRDRWGPPVRCWRERVWDDWSGRWRRVRVCN